MSELENRITSEVVTGKMFLYEQPELLTFEDHGNLGLTPPEKPFEFATNARAIPLLQTEFASAQRHYPIVFSSTENPMPLAITGIIDERNLFIDDNGRWNELCYIPSYLRCYPFALATAQGTRMAAVIDRAASSVVENATFPFFENEELTENTQKMMEFCAKYQAERTRTIEFCTRVKELGLLTVNKATHRPAGADEDQLIANFATIDTDKLTALDDSTLVELHRNGQLSAMYLQAYSIENWRHLVTRRDVLMG